MAILTVAQFREHEDTSLEDDAVQRLLDGAEAEIVRFAGATGSATELHDGGGRFLILARPAASITSITETYYSTVTTLATDDYLLYPDGYTLERLNTGTTPRSRWYGRVAVISTPADDADIRVTVQIDLVKLMLGYAPGVTAEQIGSWMEQRAANSAWNASMERESILARLSAGPSMVVIG